MSGILGTKIGMTSIYDEKGKVIPCTVIEAGPCYVAQIKTKEKDKVESYQLAFNPKKKSRVSKPLIGHFAKSGIDPVYHLEDFRKEIIGQELNLGDVIKADIFKVGDMVDVIGTSKGKGFSGVVKRHGFGGGSRTHGQSDRMRAPGSVGGSSYPSRTFKGQRMAGRMGTDTITVQNLQVVRVVLDSNLIVVKGAIPGKNSGYVRVVTTKK